MIPWVAHRIQAIRDHERIVTRLFGPDTGGGIGTGAWHPSTPEARWNCGDGHLPDEDGIHCCYCGAAFGED